MQNAASELRAALDEKQREVDARRISSVQRPSPTAVSDSSSPTAQLARDRPGSPFRSRDNSDSGAATDRDRDRAAAELAKCALAATLVQVCSQRLRDVGSFLSSPLTPINSARYWRWATRRFCRASRSRRCSSSTSRRSRFSSRRCSGERSARICMQRQQRQQRQAREQREQRTRRAPKI